jgi:hypothetical protein
MHGGHIFSLSTTLKLSIDRGSGLEMQMDSRRNPLQDETDLTDARMDHDASTVSPISVSVGLALLAF